MFDTVEPQPLSSTIFCSPTALKLYDFMGFSSVNPWVMYFSKRCSFSNSKKYLE